MRLIQGDEAPEKNYNAIPPGKGILPTMKKLVLTIIIISALWLAGCSESAQDSQPAPENYCGRGLVIYAAPSTTVAIFVLHDLSGLEPIPYNDEWMQLSEHEFVRAKDLLCE